MNQKLKHILLTILIVLEVVVIGVFVGVTLKEKFQDNSANLVTETEAEETSRHADGLFYSKTRRAYVYYRQGKLASGKVKKGKTTYLVNRKGEVYGVENAVPLISQLPELPTGCEMTAVTMLLQYKGIKVTKFQVADQTPKTVTMDANQGFIGDPYKVTGGWVYPQGIAPVLQQYLGTSDDLTGTSLSKIYQKLLHGHPVIIWLANFDGQPNHAVTLTGYKNKTIFYNDPWTNRRDQISQADLLMHWDENERRALSY